VSTKRLLGEKATRRAGASGTRWPLVLLLAAGCHKNTAPAATSDVGTDTATSGVASLPLVPVADIDLPGKPVRFDYQDLDPAKGHLVIAHMNDASVVIVNLRDGSVVKVLPDIPTARGIAVAADVRRIFVTSAPNKLVIVDADTLSEIGRVDTGSKPDGVGWDPVHDTVGVSDQGDGAISLLAESGSGARTQLKLGTETGNVVFDASRAVFWITVVGSAPPDRLVAVDPVTAKETTSIALPGCTGAHGLRIHPDGKSALVACEDNSKLVRVDLGGPNAMTIVDSGKDPDVLAIDPGLGWLYVAAESGDLTVFDLGKPGLVTIDREHPGDASHSVAVDPATHHVFFPLVAGPKGTPILRIMKPAGT
jgi:DNA-binding beta-propeller fold protein YncE